MIQELVRIKEGERDFVIRRYDSSQGFFLYEVTTPWSRIPYTFLQVAVAETPVQGLLLLFADMFGCDDFDGEERLRLVKEAWRRLRMPREWSPGIFNIDLDLETVGWREPAASVLYRLTSAMEEAALEEHIIEEEDPLHHPKKNEL